MVKSRWISQKPEVSPRVMGINTLLASWSDLSFQVPGDVKRSCNCDTGRRGESGWIQSRTVVDDLWQMFGDLCMPGGWGRSGLKFCLTFPEQVCSHSCTKDGCFLPASFSGSLAFNGNKWATLLTLWRAALPDFISNLEHLTLCYGCSPRLPSDIVLAASNCWLRGLLCRCGPYLEIARGQMSLI